MKSREALQRIAEVTASQWGLVTSAQARLLGISHMHLTRLNEAGELIRLTHGVYRLAGAPSPQHELLRAAWLATDPGLQAHERLTHPHLEVVVSGESAAALLSIGNFRAAHNEFTCPRRRQTGRPDVQFRHRDLAPVDVTLREGLPVTTPERTIADLVEARQDLGTVTDALRDASRQTTLNLDHLRQLLAPLARRNGCRPDDGAALLEVLLNSESPTLTAKYQEAG
ncbi:MAG: type IV toxin-antitoxin system AbiEi family antitoxin domain-containing protein [Propionibacteriaceae bacterium]|nr:type IV toxin-antitoxin system AbiEi family antitoxin domain-containing protein [Propionibacteriaceae bacterium]